MRLWIVHGDDRTVGGCLFFFWWWVVVVVVCCDLRVGAAAGRRADSFRALRAYVLVKDPLLHV